jgi:acetylglutamate kinase
VLILVKYGGNAMAGEGPDPVLDDVAALALRGERVVIVHGGGPQIDAALRERGISEPRVGGLRVTGAAARDVVEAVLCGQVNKALVRALAVRGVRAVGLSGEDGGLVTARRIGIVEGVDLGYVGVVEKVDPRATRALLDAGFVPVVAPLALDGESGAALNVNADTVAGALAGALGADAYVVVSNIPGVLRDIDDPASTITHLSVPEAQALLREGTLRDGMIPKMQAAIDAVRAGAKRALIGASVRDALAGTATELVA